MKIQTLAVLCTGTALLASTGFAAQLPRAQGTQPQGQAQTERAEKADKGDVCLASDLMNAAVFLKDKEEGQRTEAAQADDQQRAADRIGTVEDVVIDQDGKVQYLAISLRRSEQRQLQQEAREQQADGQREGRRIDGDQLTLVPFEKAKTKKSERPRGQASISLEITRDQLAQAPKFTKEQLLSTDSQEWMAKIDEHFGTRRGVARPELEDRQRQQGQQPQPQRQPQPN